MHRELICKQPDCTHFQRRQTLGLSLFSQVRNFEKWVSNRGLLSKNQLSDLLEAEADRAAPWSRELPEPPRVSLESSQVHGARQARTSTRGGDHAGAPRTASPREAARRQAKGQDTAHTRTQIHAHTRARTHTHRQVKPPLNQSLSPGTERLRRMSAEEDGSWRQPCTERGRVAWGG